MKNLTYDIEKRCFVDSSSKLLLGWMPEFVYGENTSMTLTLRGLAPSEVANVTAWRMAADTDYAASTAPMILTESGITADLTGDHVVLTIPVNTVTNRFATVCDGRAATAATMEICGLGSGGDIVAYYRFGINCLWPIYTSYSPDPDPEPTPDPDPEPTPSVGGLTCTTSVSGYSGTYAPTSLTTTYNGQQYPIYYNGSYYLAMRSNGRPALNSDTNVSSTGGYYPMTWSTLGAAMTPENLTGTWYSGQDDWDDTFTWNYA